MKKLWIGAAIMLILLATLAVPYDNSDDPDDLRRSGMIVFTDHLTGCQYLGRVVGGLTPQLRDGGTQVCRAQADK